MPEVVVVTGAARGIGLATAKKFLSEGWRVALLDIDGKSQERARDRLNAPDNTLAIEFDVSDPVQVAAAVEEVVARFHHIDALVTNFRSYSSVHAYAHGFRSGGFAFGQPGLQGFGAADVLSVDEYLRNACASCDGT